MTVKEFYQQNYQPVYGVEIRGSTGKVRFGTTLSEAEKHWLVADLRRVIWPEPDLIIDESGAPVERLGSAESTIFEVEFPPVAIWKSMAGLSIVLVVVSVFLAVGIFAMKDQGIFRFTWLGITSLVAVALLFAVREAWRNSVSTVRVSGDAVEIRVRTFRNGKVVREQAIPRTPTAEARLYERDSADSSMVNVEILDGALLRVVTGYPADAARKRYAELAAALS